MLTEQTLRDYPDLVKVMTGVPADDFWALMAAVETEYPTITRQRPPAKERQRAPGGGRPCDLPLEHLRTGGSERCRTARR